MGVRFPSVGSNVIANAALPNGVETIVCTLPPLSIALDFAQIFLWWWGLISNAGNGTLIQWRLRRGTTTAGALVNVSQSQTLAAAWIGGYGGCYPDTPGAIAAQQYVLTCTISGAGANGTCLDVALLAASM